MLPMPRLNPCATGDRIAFFGPMVSGKTYCANALVENEKYIKVAFANKLKEIAKDLYGVVGKNGKDRELLQALGADLRKHDPEVWIKYLLHEVEKIEGRGQFWRGEKPRIVLDDLRYENEGKYLKENGFLLILVTVPEKEREWRLSTLYPETPLSSYYHESERQWQYIPYDGVVESSAQGRDVLEQIQVIRNHYAAA